jgi:hypothetical protein
MVTTLLKLAGSQKVVGSNPISSTSLFSTLITQCERESLVDFAYKRTAVGSITLALARSGRSRHPHGDIVD